MAKTIWLNDKELEKIRLIANRENLTTRSKIYPGHYTDPDKNQRDQLTGNLGEAALSKFLTGSINLYLKTKQQRELTNWTGDYKTDLLGLTVDVKARRMRHGPDVPYKLYIREREYQVGMKYVLALIPDDRDDKVELVGWIHGSEVGPPTFEDRREVRQNQLHKF